MTIGLIDVDSHNFPNLALMKLSAWHKAQGDTVEWWWGFGRYDRVYMSKVFDATYSEDQPEPLNTMEVIRGGTGYGLDNRLPDEVEHIYPDYSLYPELTKDTAYGFLTRGCPRACGFCIVAGKEGQASMKTADLSEWWSGQKYIKLLDPNLLACPEHMDLLGQLADSGAWVDFTQGLDVRLTNARNVELIRRIRTKNIHFAWDNPAQDLAEHFRRFKDLSGIKDYRKLGVYVLTNYGDGETPEEKVENALRRINTQRWILIQFARCLFRRSAQAEVRRALCGRHSQISESQSKSWKHGDSVIKPLLSYGSRRTEKTAEIFGEWEPIPVPTRKCVC